MALKYVRSLPRDEPKVLIGNNLASHINHNLIPLCPKHKIRMVFLTPNATQLLHPLDVAVSGPLKKHWRAVLTAWKEGAGMRPPEMGLPKTVAGTHGKDGATLGAFSKGWFQSMWNTSFECRTCACKDKEITKHPAKGRSLRKRQPSTAGVPSENKKRQLCSSRSWLWAWTWWTS